MGEEEVFKEYDDSIEACSSHPAIVAMLKGQKTTLLGKIAMMKGMESK
jgi:hypothetical protein